MDDSPIPVFPAEEPPEGGSFDDRSYRRWFWLMAALAAVGCITFALTTLWLTRIENPLAMAQADTQATQLVEAHFAALERGDFRAAYDQFSARFRRRLSFKTFQIAMANHWRLLRGNLTLFPHAETANRVMVNIHFEGDEGTELNAEFTLIRRANRWWIDDVRWGRAGGDNLIYT
jgi:ketosteroid isomerase-like protein